MKLNEFLKDYFERIGPNPTSAMAGDYLIGPEELEILKDELLKCEEFKGIEKIHIIDLPEPISQEVKKVDNGDGSMSIGLETKYVSKEDEDRVPYTYKFNSSIIFNKEIYLHNIFLSPEIHDTSWGRSLNFKGWERSPTLTNPEDFTPGVIVRNFFSMENFQDESALNSNHINNMVDEYRKFLLEVIDGKHKPAGKRGIFIRLLGKSINIDKVRDMSSNEQEEDFCVILNNIDND